mmetsp:Transcript_39452/g.68796  ORF Transcript_39452/g.68796 Transcript_39452/m.68796 type:complete len:185 (+) Transcript_39452:59-613(+)
MSFFSQTQRMALLVTILATIKLAFAFVAHTPAGLRSTSVASYVPDGLTDEQYQQIKEKERDISGKALGRVGPTRFKSRSMTDWQKAGGKHLFAVDPKKISSGEIPIEEVPYMQRRGAWDNSDIIQNKNLLARVKDIKKIKVAKTPEEIEYEQGGYKKHQSISYFESFTGDARLPWNNEIARKIE